MTSSLNNNHSLVSIESAKRLLVSVLVALFSASLAQGLEKKYIIQGVVRTSDGRPSVGAVIELKRIAMSPSPTIETIEKIRSDNQGGYVFRLTKVKPKQFFRIDIRAESISIGSDPLKFKNAQNVIIADFTLPEISHRTDQINVEKNIYVFDFLESGIQITEIINLLNKTEHVIDTRQATIEKTIPAVATDFYFLKKNDNFNVFLDSEKVIFRLLVPPGQHQLYFSYNIPVSGNSVVFQGELLTNTSEVELIVPDNGPEVSFLFNESATEREIVHKDQYYGNRLYHSKLLPIKNNMIQFGIKIQGIPVNPISSIYPVGVLIFLLLAGLFWFLISRYQPQVSI